MSTSPRLSPEPRAGWVSANLVVGADGSTTFGGSSRGLSTSVDRAAFHRLRQECDAILIGGNTARNEPYQATPCPLIVLSHLPLTGSAANNPLAEKWDLPLAEALSLARRRFGRTLMEAGPALLVEAIREKLIDELFLTRSPITGGENPLEIDDLLQDAAVISSEDVEGTLLLQYRF